MGYSKEEQETTLVFDNSTGLWNVYSTTPKHITKIRKLTEKKGLELIVLESEGDRPIAVKTTFPEKMILIRDEPAKRELTEEQIKERTDRLSKVRKARQESRKTN